MEQTNSTQSISKITATQIAQELNVTAKMVNSALLELGYMAPAPISGYVLLRESFGEQCQTSGDKPIPFVKWNSLILKNKVFLRTIEEMSGPKSVSVEAPVKVEEENKSTFKFDRGTFKAEFRTTDGHFVRSKAEVVIDNWLYANGLVHAYERRLPIKEEVYTDFFIPVHNIYIEFWGLEDNPKYADRKAKKIAMYKTHNLKLVELNEEDIKNIDDSLPLKLLKHGLQVN